MHHASRRMNDVRAFLNAGKHIDLDCSFHSNIPPPLFSCCHVVTPTSLLPLHPPALISRPAEQRPTTDDNKAGVMMVSVERHCTFISTNNVYDGAFMRANDQGTCPSAPFALVT
jgi:hypothetical protein